MNQPQESSNFQAPPPQSQPSQQPISRPPFPPGVRPPPPPRPQGLPGQRPPMPPGMRPTLSSPGSQMAAGQRPPMPVGMRPPPPPSSQIPLGQRPPPPQIPLAQRPPIPSQSSSIQDNNVSPAFGSLQRPLAVESPASHQQLPSIPVIQPLNSPVIMSQQFPVSELNKPPVYSPPMTLRPPGQQISSAQPSMPMRPPGPPIPGQQFTPQPPNLSATSPSMPVRPLGPPIPGHQFTAQPSVPVMSPNLPVRPLGPPIPGQQFTAQPSVPVMSPILPVRPLGPPIPGQQFATQQSGFNSPSVIQPVQQFTAQPSVPSMPLRPPGPPIPGQSLGQPIFRPPPPNQQFNPNPNPRPPTQAPFSPPQPPQAFPIRPQVPTVPTVPTGMSPPPPLHQHQYQNQPLQPLQQQYQQYQQPPIQAQPLLQQQQPLLQQQQQQQFQNQFQAGYQAGGFPQGPGQGFPGAAPLTVSSSTHNLKELYDSPPEPQIKPNIHHDFLTCSLGKIPRNASLLGKARTPFGLTVSFYPYGDVEKDKVPEINSLIVRCRRCRTYLNPFAELIEQGSRWRCNMCFLANEFPPNYDFDQTTQTNIDRGSHVEFKNFVYDFTNAPIEYTVRPPQPPVYLFALEVTAAAVLSGLFASSCRVIQEQLDSIPNEDGRARVALITFDQRIQFYKMSQGEPRATVFVVADAAEPFLPAFSDLLVNLSECRSQIDSLLDQLPEMHATPSKASPALGPVLQSAHMLLKSVGGKVIVVMASLPTQFEGALKARDDPKLLGTSKESTLLQPANQFYKLFASEIVKDQICVDLFVAPPQLSPHTPIYSDLASLSGLTKYTGGKLHYYPEFGSNDAIAGKFCSDLRRFLGQPHGYEAVLRIRASQGISLSAYHGSFFLRQTDLLSLPNVNPDHSFSAQANIDENLQGSQACFQAALLHTTCRGERRIRVINFALPIVDDIKQVFSNINVNGIAGLLSKMAVEKVLANRLEDAREAVLNKCSDIISAFKTQNGLKSNQTLILPENMKNFAILLHALIKSLALRSGNQTHLDLRAHTLTLWKTLSASEIIGLILPRFFAIHSMESDCGIDGKLPNFLNLSSEKLERHGIFLLENGFQQFLWVGSNVHQELLNLLFGTSILAQIPSGRTSQLMPDLDNDWNRRVHSISDSLRSKYGRNVQPEFYIIKDDSDLYYKQLFLANLIEDRSIDGTAPSYAQWLMEVNTRANSSS